jgi:hypothetical protein
LNDPRINFINFHDAVCLAQETTDVEFIGIKFDPPFKHLGVYSIVVRSDEPGEVSIMYEGGQLFSSCGEEEFYFLDDVPAQAKELIYARKSDLCDVQISGMTSEFVLQKVLPGLRWDSKYRDQAHFMQVAGAEFAGFWRNP